MRKITSHFLSNHNGFVKPQVFSHLKMNPQKKSTNMN